MKIKLFLTVLALALLSPGLTMAQNTISNSNDANINTPSQTNTQTSSPSQTNSQSITTPTVAPLPNIVGPTMVPPQIYGSLGNTPAAASTFLVPAANELCGLVYTRDFRPNDDTVTGKSGRTKVIFAPFPSLMAKKGSDVQVQTVLPPALSPKVYKNVLCLGMMTVFTDEKVKASDFSIVQNDAVNYLLDNIVGYRHAILVSPAEAISAASGVASDVSSVGVGAAAGKVISLLTLGLAPSFNQGAGQTKPTNSPGGAFLVLAYDVPEPEGSKLDVGELTKFFPPAPQPEKERREERNSPPPAIKNEVTK